MKVLCWFIPKSLIKKNTPLWFLKLGFLERTSPRELGRTTRIRWFQKGREKVLFFEGEFILHKYGIGEWQFEGITIRYIYENKGF